MDLYELKDIDAKTLAEIRNLACPDAPWKALGEDAMAFLEVSGKAGLKWKIHSDVLTSFIEPKTKEAKKKQQEARRDISWSANLNFTPSGILLFEENESGRWSGDDDKENRILMPDPDLPVKENLMARVMEVFWPDIPPLAWNRLTNLLVHREFEEKRQFYGNHQYAQDYLDFGKAYLALRHANKLEPQEILDWEKITQPPGMANASPKP